MKDDQKLTPDKSNINESAEDEANDETDHTILATEDTVDMEAVAGQNDRRDYSYLFDSESDFELEDEVVVQTSDIQLTDVYLPKDADNSQDDFTDITNEFIDVDIVCGEDLGILGEPTPFQYSTENLSSFKVPEMISPITSNYTENVQEPTEDAVDELIGDFEKMGEYFEEKHDTKEDIIQVAETSTEANSETEISENNFGTDLYCENSKTFINCKEEITSIYDIIDKEEVIKEETNPIKQEYIEPEKDKDDIKNDYSVENEINLRRSARKREAKKLECCPSSDTNNLPVDINLESMKTEQKFAV